MDVLSPRCGGLDVHKQSVVACRLVADPGASPRQEGRTVTTLTDDLLRLADWLAAAAVTHVAMESTGGYWKPVSNLLEDRCALLLVNAAHVKAVPGRKTDVRDGEWLAEVLRHGLLRGRFVPDRPPRELRELTRSRTSLVRERAAEANRVQQVLAGATVKLASVASDVVGVAGREMLAALIAGSPAAAALADLARGRLREQLPQLARALAGRVEAHQRFLLAHQLAHIDFLAERIAAGGVAIDERLRPFAAELRRLATIPGVARTTAENLLAELGADMSRFPSDGHLASWAGRCPGHHERAGTVQSGKTRKGSPWRRGLLIQAAHAAARTKGTYLAAQYRRLAPRRGRKKAAVAVGHSILVIADHLLTEGTTYQEVGADYFDQRERPALARRLVRRLEGLGYTVALAPAPA
jgi:transposase